MDTSKPTDRLRNVKKVMIYGAQAIAFGVYSALKEVWGIETICFVVTRKEDNPAFIENIPVICITDCHEDKKMLVLIATPEPYHQPIANTLDELGYTNYLPVDSPVEYELMSQYFRKGTQFKLLEDLPLCESCPEMNSFPDIRVLMVKSHADKPLKRSHFLNDWIIPIQAGAALTDIRIADCTDYTGENISLKNANYSELTATYWAWKNLKCEYKGIFHYRRIIEMGQTEILRMQSNHVDVVLPLPFVCYPDTRGQYGRYIAENDIQVAFHILQDMEPRYFDVLRSILGDKYLYNYNILIARARVFDEYSQWLFPLLAAIEHYYTSRGISRRDRYLGYIGEILTAVYFLCNFNQLNIVHGQKTWLV